MTKGGCDYLYKKNVISKHQCVLGRMYYGWYTAFHSNNEPKSCLSNLIASDYQDATESRYAGEMEAKDWYMKVSNELYRRSIGDAIPYNKIILDICVFGSSIRYLRERRKVGSSTISKWVRQSFDELEDVVEGLLCVEK